MKQIVRTRGSDRTVAKDEGTSDRTDHDHGNPNRIGLIRSRIGLIMNAWHGFLCGALLTAWSIVLNSSVVSELHTIDLLG